MTSPISFISDFGHHDEFVGVVHGVIAKLAPQSQVIDLNHSIGRGDIKAGALSLVRAIQYLPEGVVLAVIDPGVGTGRRALAVSTHWGHFVGPDNGVLSPAVAMVGGALSMVSIESGEVMIPSPGATFQGRDVFAPAAALLASGGARLEDLGPVVDPDSTVPLLLPLPEAGDESVTGEVWWVDHFGNSQTNIGPDELAALSLAPGGSMTVRIGSSSYEMRWVTAYGDADSGELVAHVDSAGLMSFAVNGGRADEELSLTEGTVVTLGKGSPTPE